MSLRHEHIATLQNNQGAIFAMSKPYEQRKRFERLRPRSSISNKRLRAACVMRDELPTDNNGKMRLRHGNVDDLLRMRPGKRGNTRELLTGSLTTSRADEMRRRLLNQGGLMRRRTGGLHRGNWRLMNSNRAKRRRPKRPGGLKGRDDSLVACRTRSKFLTISRVMNLRHQIIAELAKCCSR